MALRSKRHASRSLSQTLFDCTPQRDETIFDGTVATAACAHPRLEPHTTQHLTHLSIGSASFLKSHQRI
jgi:hypothetical protein